MKAVIMAGGKGTRLSSLLQDIPKPMIQIAGKPVLEHQIENLKENGITEIILVIGHLGEVIEEYFNDGSKWSVSIQYFREQEPLGTAGALFYLKDRLTEDFYLLFGDVFVNINFQRMANFHRRNDAVATLFAHPNSHPYDSDLLVIDESQRVTGWLHKNGERTKAYKNLVNAGIYIFSSDIFRYISDGTKRDLEKGVILSAIEQGKVYAYCSTEYVKDIGTPDRYAKVCEDYQRGVCEARNLKNRQKCIFLDRDGTINRYVGLLTDARQMELERHVSEAITKINQSEYLAIVITNQPVVARGDCTFKGLEEIHNRMHVLLGEKGCYVDDIYFCPHHPDCGFEGEVKELKIICNCRKPEVGMIQKAVLDHNIDLEHSWFIGDTTLDIQTGKNAGTHTALVLTGEAGNDGKYPVKAELTGDDLLGVVTKIIGA
ncbi:MAG: HAD-IIIA family hydrolase [Lachnospiraceae bacterium]|nr:HAD-IIIA family hydrolase [Lachnospiraceae bacterium]